jgi:hypothetical protein
MRRTTCGWFLAMALATMGQAQGQPPAPDKSEVIVTLDQGPAYEATRKDGHWVASLYVTIAAKYDSKSVVAGIKGVSAGTRSDAGLAALFEAPVPVVRDGRLASIDLATKSGVDVPRGIYSILLSIASGQVRQLATVQLTIPAAVLAPAHLSIERVLPFLGMGSGGEAPSLILRETGARSPAAVQFVEDRFSDANGEYGGQLKLDGATVPEGGQTTVKYDLEGKFPLGTAKSTLTVLSHQLESPATVAVEVRTRRTRALLLFLVAIGLIMGFLMRTLLKQQIQFGEARQAALDELSKLKRERDGAADDEYANAITTAMKHLADRIRHAKVSAVGELAGAVTTAEAALKTAADALKVRTDEVTNELKTVAEVVEARWRVPEPVASKLRVCQAKLGAIKSALARGNIAEAAYGIGVVSDSLRSALEHAMRPTRTVYTAFVADASAVGQLLLPEAQEDFKAELKQMKDLTAAMRDVAAGDKPADFKTLLNAMTQARSAAESLVDNLGIQVTQTFTTMDEELAHASVLRPFAWTRAREDTRKFAAALARVPDDMGRLSPIMRTAASDLHGHWWTSLSIQADDPAPAQQLFNEGKYKEAAAAIAEDKGKPAPIILGKRPLGILRLEEDEEDTEEKEKLAPPPRHTPAAVEEPDVPIERVYQPRRAESIRAIEARTFKELLAAKALQWVISAAGLALIGYLLFADKFVGTAPELVTAFFWGFTTDVGLDALISAGKPKSASG